MPPTSPLTLSSSMSLRRLCSNLLHRNLHRQPFHRHAMSTFTRLVRFLPKDSGAGTTPLIGQPVDAQQDVGLATYAGEKVEVEVWSGRSVLEPGEATGERVEVGRVLSPVGREEVGMIRCIGLNVRNDLGDLVVGHRRSDLR